MLTEEERRAVDAFAAKIDITDSTAGACSTAPPPRRTSLNFSESALSSVRTKDLGDRGRRAEQPCAGAQAGFGQPEKKGFRLLPAQQAQELEAMKAQYAKAEANVDKIAEMLEGHQVTLMKDVAMLDQMYDLNQQVLARS